MNNSGSNNVNRNSMSEFLVLVSTPPTFARVVSTRIFPLDCWMISTSGLLSSETVSTRRRKC